MWGGRRVEAAIEPNSCRGRRGVEAVRGTGVEAMRLRVKTYGL